MRANLIAICVVALVGLALGQTHVDLADGVGVAATTGCNQYSYFKFTVTELCMDLYLDVVQTQGQPDLYVSKDEQFPTLASLTWTSYEWGEEHMVIRQWDPEFILGDYYIAVHAFCSEEEVDTGLEEAVYTITVHTEATTIPAYPVNGSILGMPQTNKVVDESAYDHYHICVPDDCGDLSVSLTTSTGQADPEVLVSTRQKEPRLLDHAWKLSTAGNPLQIAATHPEARPGHYFISVYGRCDAGVTGCGPITYTLSVTSVDNSPCPTASQTEPAGVLTLEDGVSTGTESAACDAYNYYKIQIVDPCADLRVAITSISETTAAFVSRAPVLNPTEDELTWGLADGTGEYALVVHQYDLDARVGWYYIGIKATCTTGQSTYSLTASSTNAENMYNSGKTSEQLIAANAYRYYRFCVPTDDVDVRVDLIGRISDKKFPDTYTWPEMLVTREVAFPTIFSYSWKLAQIERRYVDLPVDHPETGAGRYFVTIFGWCTPDEYCGEGACGPCSNYANDSPYQIDVYEYNAAAAALPPRALALAAVVLAVFLAL